MKLIGLSGKMTAGKTTLAEKLVKENNFVRLAIGDEIKRTTNLVIEDFDQLSNKKLLKGEERLLNTLKKEVGNLDKSKLVKEGEFYKKNEVYRTFTQNFGTIFREYLGEDVWCNMLFDKINELIKEGKDKIICDDVRTKREYESLKQKGFELIRIEVSPEKQKERILNIYEYYDPKSLKHITETDLDDAHFEHYIDTTKDTIEDSFNNIQSIILKKDL